MKKEPWVLYITTRTPRSPILKEDGVEHGCVCTEAGVLLDIFTPMREDFV